MRSRQKMTPLSGGMIKSGNLAAYVYAVSVDGVIRYIGKGHGERMFAHATNARRTAARAKARSTSLHPRLHRNLVIAITAGSKIAECVIASGLSERQAGELENQIIVEFHRDRTGQLWNTIDERFMDRRMLPEKWGDPEHPLYRLPRPLKPHGCLAEAAGVKVR